MDEPGDLVRYRAFADTLCEEAGRVLLMHFRSGKGYEVKSDRTPVTVADREVEALVRARIGEVFPSHGIIGEEAPPTNPGAELTWVIDPIDGTKSFATGKPVFGSLIGLCRGGRPVLGALEAPATAERWLAIRGEPTRFDGALANTRPPRALQECVMYTTSPDLFEGREAAAFQRLRGRVAFSLYGADCYAYGMLARGDIDLVVEAGLADWDWCALVPIVEEAGGTMTDWSGEPLALGGPGQVLAASSPEVAARAREVLLG